MSETLKVTWTCRACAESGELNLPEPLSEFEIFMTILQAHKVHMHDLWQQGPTHHVSHISYRIHRPRRRRIHPTLF